MNVALNLVIIWMSWMELISVSNAYIDPSVIGCYYESDNNPFGRLLRFYLTGIRDENTAWYLTYAPYKSVRSLSGVKLPPAPLVSVNSKLWGNLWFLAEASYFTEEHIRYRKWICPNKFKEYFKDGYNPIVAYPVQPYLRKALEIAPKDPLTGRCLYVNLELANR